jgi:hypothetical protein
MKYLCLFEKNIRNPPGFRPSPREYGNEYGPTFPGSRPVSKELAALLRAAGLAFSGGLWYGVENRIQKKNRLLEGLLVLRRMALYEKPFFFYKGEPTTT